MQTPLDLPSDLATAHAMIVAERAARTAVEQLRTAERLLIEKLQLEIARLKREKHGASSERGVRLEQLELTLEDLQETLAEATVVAEVAVAAVDPVKVEGFDRRRPARRPLPEHLPRHRVVLPNPTACPCCSGTKLSKIGEDITESLERIPASWRVIQHVREKLSCRACETISQPPAPFHPLSRGRAGPNLLAEVVFGKYGQHLPLHRQAERFAREGVPIEESTLCDWVGGVSVALRPILERIVAHVRAGDRIHVDDTTVPVLAKGKTRTGRLWTVVRDDKPFGGNTAPAAVYFYSPTRSGDHVATWLDGWTGIMQADAFAGYNQLYASDRRPKPILEAACWSHGRRKFFELADLKRAPMAIEVVKDIDAIFAAERAINGMPPDQRLAVRRSSIHPFVEALEVRLRSDRAKLSPKSATANAIDYMLTRWSAFTRFLDDGRICLTNNAAERALRGIAVGRRNWTFAGSDAGGQRAAALYSLIETAKLNDIDPKAWLADILARLPGHPAKQIDELLPWNWKPVIAAQDAA